MIGFCSCLQGAFVFILFMLQFSLYSSIWANHFSFCFMTTIHIFLLRLLFWERSRKKEVTVESQIFLCVVVRKIEEVKNAQAFGKEKVMVEHLSEHFTANDSCHHICKLHATDSDDFNSKNNKDNNAIEYNNYGDVSSDDGYYDDGIGMSPPPPYSSEDLIGCKDNGEKEKREDGERRESVFSSTSSSCLSPVEANPTIEYNDVGEEITATVSLIFVFNFEWWF